MAKRTTFLSSVAALIGGASLYLPPVAATTITFDDLSDNGLGTAIADGYQGLNWANWFVLNTPLFTPQGRPKRRCSRHAYASQHRI